MSTVRLITLIHRLILTLAMTKVVLVFSVFYQIQQLLAISVDPYHRHVIVSPHSASEVFYTGSERQILAPAPLSEASVPIAASATPVTAIAPAPAAFSSPVAAVPAAAPAAPLAYSAPAAAVAPVAPLHVAAPAPVAPLHVAAPAPVALVGAKVAQFKLSYPQYAYGYSVQDFTTGDNKVAKEVREGGIVKGSYSVADPDGTKRTVNYYADPVHGFNAVVHKTQILK